MNKNIFTKIIISSIVLGTAIFPTAVATNIASAEEGYINIDSNSDLKISKEMTRSELIAYFAKENNVSLPEAEVALFNNTFQERAGYKYRTFSRSIGHGARIEFYTQGDGWNSYYAIERVLNVSIKHSSKSFAGKVFANLESNSSIYYDVEGELLEGATTTVSGSLNIGIGSQANINLGASYSSNVYAHISTSGRISL